MGLPDIGMRIGPLCDLAAHLRTGCDGAIHGKGPEGAEEGAVEQRTPARIEDSARPTGAGDEVPDADVFGVGLAAVLFGAAGLLRLHPERAAFGLRMPEGFTARTAASEVH